MDNLAQQAQPGDLVSVVARFGKAAVVTYIFRVTGITDETLTGMFVSAGPKGEHPLGPSIGLLYARQIESVRVLDI